MVVVNEHRCAGCGLCARICHEQCISYVNGAADQVACINHALCSTCTQCVAVCPRQALQWGDEPPVKYDRRRQPEPDQIEELFKERRTLRQFKADKIDRTIIAEIINCGIYAPTNNYDLRAVVVDDQATIVSFDEIIMRYVLRTYNLFYKTRPVFNLLSMLTPLVNAKTRVKMARSVERGRSFETLPAAMVFVVGDRRILLSEASAHYALYNMIFYAQVKGIGSRIQSAGPMVLDKSKVAKNVLGLQRHEHILAALDLGYPAIRFQNKVEGKMMRICWIEGEEDNNRKKDDQQGAGHVNDKRMVKS